MAANAQRVGQVIINHILNGAEALTDKGQSLNIRSYYESERAKVILEVRDSGEGIESEHLSRFSTRFSRLSGRQGGPAWVLPSHRKLSRHMAGAF